METAPENSTPPDSPPTAKASTEALLEKLLEAKSHSRSHKLLDTFLRALSSDDAAKAMHIVIHWLANCVRKEEHLEELIEAIRADFAHHQNVQQKFEDTLKDALQTVVDKLAAQGVRAEIVHGDGLKKAHPTPPSVP